MCPHLSKHAQRYLARAARIIDCRRDDVLYRVGDVGQYFYIVLEGEVELCQVRVVMTTIDESNNGR